jgi:hypothetical protein
MYVWGLTLILFNKSAWHRCKLAGHRGRWRRPLRVIVVSGNYQNYQNGLWVISWWWKEFKGGDSISVDVLTGMHTTLYMPQPNGVSTELSLPLKWKVQIRHNALLYSLWQSMCRMFSWSTTGAQHHDHAGTNKISTRTSKGNFGNIEELRIV